MSNNIRTLEVFNTLEVFKRREYKLLRQSVGSFAITAGVVATSTSLLPDMLAVVPTVLVGIPTSVYAFKKAYEADKVSKHADGIFKENATEIMNYKLSTMSEVEQFATRFPTLSKKYPNLLK